ncbi:ribose 5-phosphate isomerase B [Anaerostipes sp.]|uniref:ribose 5-phosphate isomerase B n=1 Tax=Anaerostipes sp. TaxID=1872530 RepID=UPI0025BE3110|nr:ribose 5-phosphate isomerase B [Anaerostipes sp.]MBS7006888.1 ribose 5-phosphate isomerase B [Anaerostipes sp.]
MKKIIFVSTNNTCRSFIAESVLRKYLKDAHRRDIQVVSKGLIVLFPEPVHTKAADLVRKSGIEIVDFKASQLTQEDVETSDLILTMNDKQKEMVLEDYHGYKEVATINEYANDEGAVIDPYGMDDEDYEHCFVQITQLIHKIWNQKLGGNEMIGIGSDHGGYALKQAVIKHLEEKGHAVKDYGCYSEESCDYPVYAKAVAEGILKDEVKQGILICGTGIGISITANKIKGIRAALCGDTFSARATREHNNANILALGARVTGEGLALDIVDTFLETKFSNDERHIRRIQMIED